MNIRPVFLDEAYATNTEWKQKLDRQHIDSCATNHNERPNCGRQCRRQPRVGQSQSETHPVFVGDTLYAESTVLSKRESVSQPTQGIVTVSTRGLNQHGKEVMSFERSMLIYRRRHSPEAAAEN